MVSWVRKMEYLRKKPYNNPPSVSTFFTPKSFNCDRSSQKPTSIPLLNLCLCGNFCNEGRIGGFRVCKKLITMRIQVYEVNVPPPAASLRTLDLAQYLMSIARGRTRSSMSVYNLIRRVFSIASELLTLMSHCMLLDSQ